VSERLPSGLAEHIQAAVAAGVESGVKKALSSCAACPCETLYDIEPMEHARHHQLLKEAFNLRRQAWNTAVRVIVGTGLFWLGLAIWERFMRDVAHK
jgi:hypothetical protein